MAFNLSMRSIHAQEVKPLPEQSLFISVEETRTAGNRISKPLVRSIVVTCLGLVATCAVLSNRVHSASGRSRQSRFLQAADDLPAEMQAVLDQHNLYRCMHGVPLLMWDADIAANAQAWADLGVQGHSPNPRTVNGEFVGENWGSCTSCNGVDRVMSWYSEIQYTSPPGLASSSSDSTVEGETVGHYTAVVWKSTTRLGCGKGRFTHSSGSERDSWICQYGSTRGNTNGLFEENVLEPVMSESECSVSTSTPLTTTQVVTTTAQPQCEYEAHLNTAVRMQGTGGSKLRRASYESNEAYLEACESSCNADATCGGFVDDPTDRRGRMCKPKTATEGYPRDEKTFYRKGSGC